MLSQMKNRNNPDIPQTEEPADSEKKKEMMEEDVTSLSEEELLQLRKFLFEERVRIMEEQEEQKALYEKFLKERLVFQEEMKALNSKVLSERKRLADENAFFEKKLQILQNGFLQLDLERKSFEKERKQFEQSRSSFGNSGDEELDIPFAAPDFFRGVNSILGLKKRYRDLLKIFHPDNLCGDNETVLEITRQYDLIRSRM